MSKVVFEFINGKLAGLPVGDANGIAGLDSGGKVPSAQLPASVTGALNYQGAWNASTNSPALVSGVGTQGYYYKVFVAGTTSIDGITSWDVGDLIAFNGTTWDKFEGNIGNLTANYIPKATSASSLGNSLIFDNGTNVGIGTTGPTTPFEVAGANQNTAYIHNTVASQSSLLAIGPTTGTQVASGNYASRNMLYGSDTFGSNPEYVELSFMKTSRALISSGAVGTGTRRPLVLEADASGNYNQLVLATAGNVGIGTTTPTAYLHLKAGTATASTAPFKFTLTSAVLNTTAEAGAVEADSSGNLYITDSSAARGQFLVGRITTKTAAYTVTSSDHTVLADMTAGAYTITLPVSPTTGQLVNIKKTTSDTNTLTIGRNGKKIEGSAADLTTSATNFPSFQLQYDGSNSWWLL